MTSGTLKNLDILNPKKIEFYDLDELKNKFGYIAKKFPHIVFKRLSQVAVMKRFERIHDYARNQSPVELFNGLAKDKDDKFDLVARRRHFYDGIYLIIFSKASLQLNFL